MDFKIEIAILNQVSLIQKAYVKRNVFFSDRSEVIFTVNVIFLTKTLINCRQQRN